MLQAQLQLNDNLSTKASQLTSEVAKYKKMAEVPTPSNLLTLSSHLHVAHVRMIQDREFQLEQIQAKCKKVVWWQEDSERMKKEVARWKQVAEEHAETNQQLQASVAEQNEWQTRAEALQKALDASSNTVTEEVASLQQACNDVRSAHAEMEVVCAGKNSEIEMLKEALANAKGDLEEVKVASEKEREAHARELELAALNAADEKMREEAHAAKLANLALSHYDLAESRQQTQDAKHELRAVQAELQIVQAEVEQRDELLRTIRDAYTTELDACKAELARQQLENKCTQMVAAETQTASGSSARAQALPAVEDSVRHSSQPVVPPLRIDLALRETPCVLSQEPPVTPPSAKTREGELKSTEENGAELAELQQAFQASWKESGVRSAGRQDMSHLPKHAHAYGFLLGQMRSPTKPASRGGSAQKIKDQNNPH